MDKDIKKQFNAEEWKEQEYLFKLEEIWRKSLPRLSDFEWLKVFPEARDILPEKVREWDVEKKRLISIAKKALCESTPIKSMEIRMALQVLVMPRINAAEKHIARLQRQIRHSSGCSTTGRITEADIQHAREVPIESLISLNVHHAGKTITAKCPLHDDRSPSFVIYRKSNSCWCFGCQQGGDSIALTQKLHNFSFIEAVKYLQKI